jgi:glutathione S-transferase
MAEPLHLIIGNKAYSSWSLRPWIAMKMNGLAFQETLICLKQPDTSAQIAKYSFAGKVPVLKHGKRTIWESLAILDYLADTFPEKAWWPKDPDAKALARSVAAEMHSGFSTLRTHMGFNARRDLKGLGRAPGVDVDIARIVTLWNDARAHFGKGGPFLFGTFTNADAMYAPVVSRFKTYGVELDPVAQAYCDAVLSLPAMQQWYAEAAAEPWTIPGYEPAV